MKIPSALVCSAVLLALTFPVAAQDAKSPAKDAVPKDYPLATCVVTDEKFGEHGEPPVAYTHQEAGKPDRLVVLCCEHCVADFKGDPARYLKKFDEAVAARAREPGSKKEEAKGKKAEAPAHKH
jgi:hypothetical protein